MKLTRSGAFHQNFARSLYGWGRRVTDEKLRDELGEEIPNIEEYLEKDILIDEQPSLAEKIETFSLPEFGDIKI